MPAGRISVRSLGLPFPFEETLSEKSSFLGTQEPVEIGLEFLGGVLEGDGGVGLDGEGERVFCSAIWISFGSYGIVTSSTSVFLVLLVATTVDCLSDSLSSLIKVFLEAL